MKSEILFLDEATSALNAANEDKLYDLVVKELPNPALTSIAHGDAVAKYHQIRWYFTKQAAAESSRILQSNPRTIQFSQPVLVRLPKLRSIICNLDAEALVVNYRPFL